MRSYIDNRGVYHRFIDWAKLFGRKKDAEETVEEKVEETVEMQELVDTRYLEDEDNSVPAVSDECVDDCPLEEQVDECNDDCPLEDHLDECADDCDGPYDGPYVYEEPITVVEEVVEPQGVVETSTESVVLEEDLKEEMPANNGKQLSDKTSSNKSKKSEKVVKEKSTAKKTTAKKTTKKTETKSRKI